jgi:hypothetical protein
VLCDRDAAPYPILDAWMQIEVFALEHRLQQLGAQTTASI